MARWRFRVGDGAGNTDALSADIPLIARQWYLVAGSYDPASGEATLYQEPIENRYNNHLSKIVPLERSCHVSGQLGVTPAAADADFPVGRSPGSLRRNAAPSPPISTTARSTARASPARC